MAHTPGPWRIGEYVKPIRYKQDDLHVLAGQMSIVCSMSAVNWSIDGEKDKANARLIAAAPDLLEALKEALPYVLRAYECAFPNERENEAIADEIRAAIAKAEGHNEIARF